MNVAIVVPALNEEPTIGRVVASVLAALDGVRVVVVDDGSADATGAVAAAAGAEVLRHPFNLGVGGAVRTGLRHVVATGADRVVIMDADDQHDAEDLRRLLGAIDGGVDLVVGSRFATSGDGYRMGRTRRAAQRFLNRVVSRLVGTPVTDATSGFRAMTGDVAELLARDYPVEYLADTVEVLVLVRRAGFTLGEVPVRMRPRRAGRSSARGVRLTLQYLRVLVGVAGAAAVRRSDHALDRTGTVTT